MNGVYLRCEDCKSFVETSERWTRAALERSGVVQRDDLIDGEESVPLVSVEAVLETAGYWQGPPADDWERGSVMACLETVRGLLLAHREHRVSFGDRYRFQAEWLDWISERELSPRFLVEGLRLRTWEEVRRFVDERSSTPWWWESRMCRTEARRKFEFLVAAVVPRSRGSAGAAR